MIGTSIKTPTVVASESAKILSNNAIATETDSSKKFIFITNNLMKIPLVRVIITNNTADKMNVSHRAGTLLTPNRKLKIGMNGKNIINWLVATLTTV